MRRLLFATLGLTLLQAYSSAAQDQPVRPIFGTGTKLVLVDFVVTGKGDAVVGGLTAKDFVVKEDGKVRPIVSFAAFGNGAPSADVGPAEVVVEPFPAAPSEPERKIPTAVAVLFVDDGQLTPQQAVRLRPALKELIDTLADRNGALALVAPWSKVSLADEVEGNRAVFTAAVNQIQGRKVEDRSTFPIADAEAYAIERGDLSTLERVTLRFVALNPGFDPDSAAAAARSRASEAVHDAKVRRADAHGVLLRSLDWLARQPGRHSVVMVSGGYARDPDDPDQRDVVNRSLQANAPIHFLDARGMQGMGMFQGVEFGPSLDRDAGETPFAFSEAGEGAVSLADDTGGIVIRNSNNMAKGLTRLFDTMTTYYVIGYEPPENGKAGYRKIKVEVQNKGLKVLARRGYFDNGAARR